MPTINQDTVWLFLAALLMVAMVQRRRTSGRIMSQMADDASRQAFQSAVAGLQEFRLAVFVAGAIVLFVVRRNPEIADAAIAVGALAPVVHLAFLHRRSLQRATATGVSVDRVKSLLGAYWFYCLTCSAAIVTIGLSFAGL